MLYDCECSRLYLTSWMHGRIESMCFRPRRSRGLEPGSTQHRLGHTGDIYWVRPGLALHLNPHRAVAIMKYTPHFALGKVQVQMNYLERKLIWLDIAKHAENYDRFFFQYTSITVFSSHVYLAKILNNKKQQRFKDVLTNVSKDLLWLALSYGDS